MHQLQIQTTTKPQMKYKVRAGTIDFGKKYEYKIAALLSLRCLLSQEDMWISSNADGLGAFDDFILHQGNKTYMVQLKHKDDPKPLVEREYLSKKGDFVLRKYLQDSVKLKETIEFQGKKPEIIDYIGSLKDISFILFTNRPTHSCNFFEESSDLPEFLNTNTSTKELKINIVKVPDVPNADYTGIIMYFLSSQIHAKLIDNQIAGEIKTLACKFNIKHVDTKEIAVTFTKYIADWAEGALGGHYCLTKFDIICKLTDLFYANYEIKFNPEISKSPKYDKTRIWHNIIQNETATLIEYEELVFEFLLEYITQEVRKYCKESKTWNEIFEPETQTAFYQNHPNLKNAMLKIVGNHGRITPLDVYKCLWINKRLPRLLEFNTYGQYKNIIKVLEFSKYDYNVLIINKSRGFHPLKMHKQFVTVSDLNEENRRDVLLQKVKLQGRGPVSLETIVEDDVIRFIKCKDIINILCDNFYIGNNLSALPEYFISRSVSRIFLQVKVLEMVLGEIFLIEGVIQEALPLNFSTACQLENVDMNKLQGGGIVFSSTTASRKEIDQLKSTKRPVHRVTIFNEHYLEWKCSFGSVRSLRDFQINLEDITENSIISKIDCPINIVTAIPGMGKSVLMDFVALNTPPNKWVLRIDLNDHQSYFKSKPCKSFTTKAALHLQYFKYSSAHDLVTESAFRKLSNSQDVIVLLDGFDEISLLYKSEVVNIAKSLRNGGYSVWITTRPYMSSYLEEELDTFAISLTSFTKNNQKEFLTNYFSAQKDSFKLKENVLHIQNFVHKLLKAAEKNLNDWDAKFTGIPLQTKLLADAFTSDCTKYVYSEGKSRFNENFDLLYLYQTFVDKKIDILCKKFGPSAEDNHFIIKDHQSCFAIKHLFPQHENLLVFQHVTQEFNVYYKDNPDRIQMFQREGIVTVDSDFNVNFVHRTFGEYLAALWLARNLNGLGDRKELAQFLIKQRFSNGYKFLFGLFDRILCQGFPMHLAIVNNDEDKIQECLDSKIKETVDAGGRSILHLSALYYGLEFPPLFEKNCEPYIISFNALKYIDSKKVDNSNKLLRFNNMAVDCQATDFLNYSPLDYALANQSFGAACTLLKELPLAINLNLISALKQKHLVYPADAALANQSFGAACALLKKPPLTISLNIISTLKKNHLVYCALLRYYELFDLLLKYFISQDILLNNMNCNMLLTEYLKTIFHFSYPSTVSNIGGYSMNIRFLQFKYEEQHKSKSILEFVQPDSQKKWLWNGTDFSDIRYAIFFGSDDNVNKILTSDIEPNKHDCYYNTLLHYAVFSTKPNIVDMILTRYRTTDVNKQNYEKNTPLHLAVSTHNNENSSWSFFTDSKVNKIVKKLIDMKANTNIKNHHSLTPFHLAVQNRNSDWIKLFLSRDTDVNIQDENGYNALHIAALNNFHDILNIIFSNSRNIKINMQNNEGETPLFCCILNNNLSIIRLLLDNSSDVNIQNIYGETILHHIATHGCNEVLHEILNRKQITNINITDNYGWTPFACALFNDQLETVKILMDNGANLNILDEKSKSHLNFAVKSGYENMLSAILVHGSSIDIDRQDKNGRTPLFNAVKNRNEAKVLQLLKLEAQVNVRDKNGVTVLHLLASGDFIEFNDTIINILNKNFINLDGNIQDNNGRTPLSYAIESDRKSTVKLFHSNGADVTTRDKDGTSSLHLLATKGYDDMLTEILNGDHNINLNIQDNSGRTPLYCAIKENNSSTVKLLLENNADINAPDKNGIAGLHLIANKGWNDILRETITANINKININIQDNNGQTPLFYAIQDHHKSTIKVFLSNNADITIRDKNGVSCLHLLSSKGSDDILSEILTKNKKININIQDNAGMTPLHYALNENQGNSVKLLLQNNANVNIQDENGTSCLHLFAAKGFQEELKSLSNVRNVNVNIQDNNGRTPLHVAIAENNRIMTKLFLSKNGDFNLKDKNSVTPLHLIASWDYDDILHSLFISDRNINFNIQDIQGRTPLDYALLNNQTKTSKLLLSFGTHVSIQKS